MVAIQVFSYRAAFGLLRFEKGSWLTALEVALVALIVSLGSEVALHVCRQAGVDVPNGAYILVPLAVLAFIAIYIRWRLATEARWAIAAMLIGISIGVIPALSTAYLLRAVWVNAYMTSSSSMAPTLYPRRYELTCENGSQIAVAERNANIFLDSGTEVTLRCPCDETKVVLQPGRVDLPTISADRFVAEKIGLSQRRWDMVVYRNPDEPEVEYVSRLIGMPGEKISLRAGDVWLDDQMLVKPRAMEDELWFPVYLVDRDLPEEEFDSWLHTTASGGSVWGQRAWTISEDDAGLEMRGPVCDRWSYMPIARDANHADGEKPTQAVADMRIDFTMSDIGEKPLEVAVDYYARSIIWRFAKEKKIEVAIGAADDDEPVAKESEGPVVQPGDRIRLVMRDGTLSVWQNGTTVLELPAIAAPPVDWDSAAVDRQLTWKGNAGWRIADIQLYRDIYYLSGDELANRFRVRRTFQGSWDLGVDELVILGDNSGGSLDSRTYEKRLKTSDVVGRVVARYWPPSRWRIFP